jgi:hypothetical protein
MGLLEKAGDPFSLCQLSGHGELDMVDRQNEMGAHQKSQLDRLVGMALIDSDIHYRLVENRDPALLNEFGLSLELQNLIVHTHAPSLALLAKVVLDYTREAGV